jgi:hypothetical protein
VDGKRIVRTSGNRSAEAWQVEAMESVLPVLPVSSEPLRKFGTDDSAPWGVEVDLRPHPEQSVH